MAAKRALITGIAGQDGAYLARLLLAKGYGVVGTHRPTSSVNLWRLKELGIADDPNLELADHDLTDLGGSIRLLSRVVPHEVYNFAAQSFVGVSFKQPVTTAQVTGLGPLHLLEAIRQVDPSIRFYQASSSEMFGNTQGTPHDEASPFRPRSPYAVSKLFAHWSTINYRDAYGLFAVSGILFNHESPLRGTEFVTRKITDAVARVSLGRLDRFELGNLDARRDWGYADEYVEAIWRMLQADSPENVVIATGKSNSVRDFVDLTCSAAGIDIRWEDTGAAEKGVDASSGRVVVQVDPRLYRPNEVDIVVGDPGKAARLLGWRAQTDLSALCRMMLSADLRRHSAQGG